MFGVFAAMIAAFGGSLPEVKNDPPRVRQRTYEPEHPMEASWGNGHHFSRLKGKRDASQRSRSNRRKK